MSALFTHDDVSQVSRDHQALATDSHQGTRASFRRTEDRQFVMMESAYLRTGGLVSGDEVARILRRHSGQPISKLARWIVERSIVSFYWNSRTLVPLFQFDRTDMSMRAGTNAVVRELHDVFDDWDLATWFAQPNAWLNDAAPVDVIEEDQPAVVQAARADRYIALG
jgi:hypothetical protein